MTTKLTWKTVDAVAESLGVTVVARKKWRSLPEGVPARRRFQIAKKLEDMGIEISLSDFDKLPVCPGHGWRDAA